MSGSHSPSLLSFLASIFVFAVPSFGQLVNPLIWCPVEICCEEDCCLEGTAWDYSSERCVPDTGSAGYDGFFPAYYRVCAPRPCCDEVCCSEGTAFTDGQGCMNALAGPTVSPSPTSPTPTTIPPTTEAPSTPLPTEESPNAPITIFPTSSEMREEDFEFCLEIYTTEPDPNNFRATRRVVILRHDLAIQVTCPPLGSVDPPEVEIVSSAWTNVAAEPGWMLTSPVPELIGDDRIFVRRARAIHRANNEAYEFDRTVVVQCEGAGNFPDVVSNHVKQIVAKFRGSNRQPRLRISVDRNARPCVQVKTTKPPTRLVGDFTFYTKIYIDEYPNIGVARHELYAEVECDERGNAIINRFSAGWVQFQDGWTLSTPQPPVPTPAFPVVRVRGATARFGDNQVLSFDRTVTFGCFRRGGGTFRPVVREHTADPTWNNPGGNIKLQKMLPGTNPSF